MLIRKLIGKHFWSFLSAIALTTTLMVSACSKSSSDNGLSPIKHELVRSIDGEPASLDPHRATGVVEWSVLGDLYEGLVEIDSDGVLKPAAAISWHTDDGQHYRFNLRKDARWSNGDPINAQDFVYSWRRLVSPETASPFASYLVTAGIRNAKEIVQGKLPPERLGVIAVSEKVLNVNLERPNYTFTTMLDHLALYPVNPTVIQEHGNDWARPGLHVSNGAYRLLDWRVNEQINIERNPFHWGVAQTQIPTVTYLPVPSSVVELNRYLANEIDITYDVPPDRINQLPEGLHNELRMDSLGLATRYYHLQTQKAPFDDVHIRKALAYAIDRNVIAQKIYGRGELEAFSLIPLNRVFSDTEKPEWSQWSQNEREAAARRLYQERGYSPQAPLQISLIHTDKDLSKREAAAVASMWRRVLGAEVTLEQYEWKAFAEKLAQGNFDAAVSGWWADYYEPSSLLWPLSSAHSSNYSRYSNLRFDAVLERASYAADDQDRMALYADAERILAADIPVIPVFHYSISRLVKPRIGGYRMHPLDTIRSKYLWIRENQDDHH